MRILRKIFMTFIAILVFFIAAYFAANAYGWEKIWPRFFGSADLGPIVFEGYKKGRKANEALICPPSLCFEGNVDRKSPEYRLSASALRAALIESLKQEKNLERVDNNENPLSLRFVQRTQKLKFPDTIRVQLFDLSDNKSTLALHSQSQIGTSDLGVNLARLKRWQRRLKEHEIESQ